MVQNSPSAQREMLMSILNCNNDTLDIIFNLFNRFEQTYGRSIISKVIKDLDCDYHADHVISFILLEVLAIINQTYDLEIDVLSLNSDDSGYEFNLEYLSRYLEYQVLDDDTKEFILYELTSWHVYF